MIKMPKGLGVFAWKRLILAIAAMLIVSGLLAWPSTPQEEDPQLAPRDGIVTVIYPGAIPTDMERLIAKPIEDELAQVDAIKTITTKLRTDFMFMQVKLKDKVSSEAETAQAWSKVQDALDRAEKKLPETAWKPDLNKEIYDQDAVLLAIAGDADRLAVFDQVRLLKDRLQSIPTVKKIDQVANPGEQLSIVFDREKLAHFGVSLENMVKQLRGGNAAIPSGYVRVADKKVSVLTNSFYRSSEELARFPIVLRSGETVALSAVANIARTPSIPVIESMRHNGENAMALGVVPQHNVNLKKFGEDVRQVVAVFKETKGAKQLNLKIDEISFQPRYVAERVLEIGLDLVKAIFLVGGVLILMLGFRVGSIVAIQVPVVTAIAFGIFSYQGGVLNQISIAAFILAIGLLVDNVVVIVDGIQDMLDRGLSPREAGEATRKAYLVPLAAGTLTTVAAFIPILISKGTVADFTRAIGVVASIALLCSYVFCIFVTPIVAAGLLRKGKARQWLFVVPLGAALGRLVARFPRTIICVALVAVVSAMMGFSYVKKQFFPFADRDLVIVDMQLPEGTHYKTTEKMALEVEKAIRADRRVVAVSTFIGRGVPPFYYNLPREPNAPHIAQFIVRTDGKKEAKEFKRDQQEALQKLVPFGVLMVKEIAQGPPIRAPIEVRVFAQDPLVLQEAAKKALAAVREAYGVCKVRSTLGVGMFAYRLDVNDSASGNFGITRAEVSAVILANTRGVPITTYRGASDPYSVNLMSKRGEESLIGDIQSGYMGSTRTDNIAVSTLTNEGMEFSAAVLDHRDRSPVVYIYAEIADGSTENVAAGNVSANIAALAPIADAKIQMGGANAESGDANRAIFMALPVGLFLLLISLMFEFNSFRRVGIILVTIPLCAVGSVPGLILSGSTFGFVTLLGFFTLAGTVIHNGIFLLDYIDHRLHEGIAIDQAITEGIQRRMRPIILTAVATIVELLPMTMSSSTLWPPFAWAIISGLSVSTLMTLLVLPSIYKLAFEKESLKMQVVSAIPAVLVAVLAFVAAAPALLAQSDGLRRITMQEIIAKAKGGYESNAASADAKRAAHESAAVWQAAFMPKIGGGVEYDRYDRPLGVKNPLAAAPLPPTLAFLKGELFPPVRDSLQGRIEVSQPLIDLAHMRYGAPSSDKLAEAAKLKAAHDVKESQGKALSYYLQILEIRAKRLALENYVTNLGNRRGEIKRLYQLGGVGEADLLKVKLGIDDATQAIREIKEKEEFLGDLLASLLGEKGCLVPDDLPADLPGAPAFAKAEVSQREDIIALGKQMESAELQAAAARATMVPKLDAFVGYTYDRQEILTDKYWADIGLRLTWVIYDGGIRVSAAAAALEGREVLENRKAAAQLALMAQAQSAQRMLGIKRQEYQERLVGVTDAKKAADLDFGRFRQGKVTVNNVIDAEDILKDRLEKAATSRVNWYQEWFRYQAALGVEPAVPAA